MAIVAKGLRRDKRARLALLKTPPEGVFRLVLHALGLIRKNLVIVGGSPGAQNEDPLTGISLSASFWSLLKYLKVRSACIGSLG